MVQGRSEKISELDAVTSMPPSSIVPFTYGTASFRATKSQLLDEYIANVSPTATGAANTAAIQACIDAARTAGGGRVRIPFIGTGNVPLTAPYRGTDGIFPGYVANDEMRRANKALIIYDAENIELCADQGVVLDRSGDLIIDDSYSVYSCTVYVSKSRNIKVHDLSFLGYQDDSELLNNNKNETSGDHIQVNNDCDGVYIWNIIGQDGTNTICVGTSRTSAYASLDPSIPYCRNTYLHNINARNGEHGILLAKADGVYGTNIRCERWTRADATTGVTQRGVYLNSCKNVELTNVRLSGQYKTSVMVTNYLPVTDVVVNGLIVSDMMTPKQISDAGGPFDSTYEGHGVSWQTDNCRNITINGFAITGVTTGMMLPGVGMANVNLQNGYVSAASNGIVYTSTFDSSLGLTTLDNPIRGFTLSNVYVEHFEDAANYLTNVPQSGLYINSGAVDGGAATVNAEDVNTFGVTVKALQRNARLLNANGRTSGCNFTRELGYSGARDYDMNYSGVRVFGGNTYGNKGRPNRSQDEPAANLQQGYAGLDDPANFVSHTVASLPDAAVHIYRVIMVDNGDDGAPCIAMSDGTNWRVIGKLQGICSTSISTLTIASGAVTATSTRHVIDTEGAGATDDLDTINGGLAGQRLVLQAANSARTVVAKDGTGNLRLAGDFSLDNTEDRIELISTGPLWIELSRSDNGA